MMWLVLVSAVLLLILVKFVSVSLFWRGRGIVYEPFYHYLYRILWVLNTKGYNEFQAVAAKRYGRVFGTYKGLTPTLATTDVSMAKEVLIKQFDNFFKRSFEFKTGEPIWDHNLTNLPHDKWKSMRSAMGHAFTVAKMKPMVEKFDVIAKRLANKIHWLVEANGGYIDIAFSEYAKQYSIDTTLAIAYGKDSNCIERPNSTLMKHTVNALKPGITTFLFFVAPNLFRYVPGVSFPPKATTDFFSGLAHFMFREKRAKLDEAVANEATDIIDRHLLQQREDPSLTDELLISQAFLLMVAGLDLTALAISISVYYLALFPDVQQRAFVGLKSQLGDRKEVRHEDVQELKYIEGCVLESFRFFPFVAQLDRICSADTMVKGIPISKGMKIEFLTCEMMQNPEYFPEPTKFQPERFVKGELAEQQELGAYLLFGDGPKHCAGKRLVLMSSVTAVANMLLNFELKVCAETPAHPPRMRPGFDFDKLTHEPLVVRIKARR